MKKTSLIITLTLILTLFITWHSYAESNQNMFGYINVVEVMQLHPLMRYFDSSSRRFQIAVNLKGDEAQKRVEENKIKYRTDLNKLEDRVKELENKRKELEETYLEKVELLIETEKKIKKMTEKEKENFKNLIPYSLSCGVCCYMLNLNLG